MDELSFTLSSPITEEQWDMISDVDLDNTNEITFHTKHGKEVKFVKAQPERKKGKWIKGQDVPNRKLYYHLKDALYCSICHEEAYWDTDYGQQLFAYCPHCGAEMEEENE